MFSYIFQVQFHGVFCWARRRGAVLPSRRLGVVARAPATASRQRHGEGRRDARLPAEQRSAGHHHPLAPPVLANNAQRLRSAWRPARCGG